MDRWTRRVALGITTLLTAAGLTVWTPAPPATAATGDLTYRGCFKWPAGSADCPATHIALGGAHAVAMSSDGLSVYVSSFNHNAVAIFTRDPATGALTAAGCVIDDDVFGGGSDPGCTEDHEQGMDEPVGIAVSPDGADVYVAGHDAGAVAHFERNSASELTAVGCVGEPTNFDGCGGTSQAGLANPFNLVAAQDAVYVATGRALIRLNRSPSTGAITPGTCVMATGDSLGCGTQVEGLGDLYDLAISADGSSLYAVSRNGDALFGFSTPAFGSLGCFYDTERAPIPGCTAAQGLDGPRGVAVSPDGKSVYAVSLNDDSLVRFDRGASGVLSAAGCVGDVGTTHCGAIQQGLNGGSDVVVSADNASVYAVTEDGGGAVASFGRDTATGVLTGKGCISQVVDAAGCASDEEGLYQPRGVVVSSDSRSVYLTSFGQDALARFDRAASSTAPPPPNDVTFRTKTTTCKGACKKIKVKIETPRVKGNAAVCHYFPDAKYCPGWKGDRLSRNAVAKKTKYVKAVFLTVTGGTTKVTLKTTKKARAKLAKKGVLKFKLQVDFEPNGGTRNSDVRKVKVKVKD